MTEFAHPSPAPEQPVEAGEEKPPALRSFEHAKLAHGQKLKLQRTRERPQSLSMVSSERTTGIVEKLLVAARELLGSE